MNQVDLFGNPIDAVPAEDEWSGGEMPRCAYTTGDEEADIDCDRFAVIGVTMKGNDHRTPVCSLHAKGPWLYAAGVASKYADEK